MFDIPVLSVVELRSVMKVLSVVAVLSAVEVPGEKGSVEEAQVVVNETGVSREFGVVEMLIGKELGVAYESGVVETPGVVEDSVEMAEFEKLVLIIGYRLVSAPTENGDDGVRDLLLHGFFASPVVKTPNTPPKRSSRECILDYCCRSQRSDIKCYPGHRYTRIAVRRCSDKIYMYQPLLFILVTMRSCQVWTISQLNMSRPSLMQG